ncbi:MAG: hypothetical protein AB7N65_27220 [Vicinamibacterales bacterium]
MQRAPRPDQPVTALTGVNLTAIDVDPDTAVVLAINQLLMTGQRVLSVVPYTSHAGRAGYLVVSQEARAADADETPRA